MSTHLSESFENKAFGREDTNSLVLLRFCGPGGINDELRDQRCLQLAVVTSGPERVTEQMTISLTRSQALVLANDILHAMKDKEIE